MKNCFECKHSKVFHLGYLSWKEKSEYKPEEHILLKENTGLSGNLMGKCALGHNERMKQFRDEHGNKTTEAIDADRSLDMECHDYHDSTKALIAMCETTDKLIELLNKQK